MTTVTLLPPNRRVIDKHVISYEVISPDSSELAQRAVQILAGEFLPRNPLTTGLADGIEEADIILLEMKGLLKHGISVAAVEQSSGEVVGVQLNAMRYENPENDPPFALQPPSTVESYAYKFLDTLEADINLFKQEHVDRYFDLFALTVAESWGGRGIGMDLLRFSLELARVNQFKLIKSTLSSVATHHMFRKLHFTVLGEATPYDYIEEGKQIFPKSDPSFSVQLVVKRL